MTHDDGLELRKASESETSPFLTTAKKSFIIFSPCWKVEVESPLQFFRFKGCRAHDEVTGVSLFSTCIIKVKLASQRLIISIKSIFKLCVCLELLLHSLSLSRVLRFFTRNLQRERRITKRFVTDFFHLFRDVLASSLAAAKASSLSLLALCASILLLLHSMTIGFFVIHHTTYTHAAEQAGKRRWKETSFINFNYVWLSGLGIFFEELSESPSNSIHFSFFPLPAHRLYIISSFWHNMTRSQQRGQHIVLTLPDFLELIV